MVGVTMLGWVGSVGSGSGAVLVGVAAEMVKVELP